MRIFGFEITKEENIYSQARKQRRSDNRTNRRGERRRDKQRRQDYKDSFRYDNFRIKEKFTFVYKLFCIGIIISLYYLAVSETPGNAPQWVAITYAVVAIILAWFVIWLLESALSHIGIKKDFINKEE